MPHACYLDAHGGERVGRQLAPHQCSWAFAGLVVDMDHATSLVRILRTPSAPPTTYALAASHCAHLVVVGGTVHFNVSPKYPNVIVGIDFPIGR